MVRIRLRRTGKTKQPSYRVVVADSRSPRDGRFIEIIGHYNPVQQPKELFIKADRARYWLSVGAKPSDTVVYLFKKEKIINENGEIIPESEFVNGTEPGSGDQETSAQDHGGDEPVEEVVEASL
jgi:small subunit ribosomal protein S16